MLIMGNYTRKIVVKIEGGLGNQLFQYAHAVALQKKLDADIYIDRHAFTKKQIRSCALSNYVLNEKTKTDIPLPLKLLTFVYIFLARIVAKFGLIPNQNRYERFAKFGLYYQYQNRCFNSLIESRSMFCYITGNWLSNKYFSEVEKDIKRALVKKEALPDACNEMLNKIISSESICIHIRLGDYLSPQWKDKLYVCTPEYYRNAIKEMKGKVPNAKFFVFSNRHKDFEMIQNEYNLGDVTYVDMGNSDVDDMELMRNCKHFIMSNSTYSWWAQYLCENSKKIVIAPSRFNNYEKWDMADIYMDNWSILSV